MTYPPQNQPPLEGEFSTWSVKWSKTGVGYYLWQWGIDERNNRLYLCTYSDKYFWALNLASGATVTSIHTGVVVNVGGTNSASILGKYFAFIDWSGADIMLRVYKNGVDIFDYDLTTYGFTALANSGQVLMSPSGKTILVTGMVGLDLTYVLFGA